VGFQVLTAASMKTIAFRDVVSLKQTDVSEVRITSIIRTMDHDDEGITHL
jgi:hypothetical protein